MRSTLLFAALVVGIAAPASAQVDENAVFGGAAADAGAPAVAAAPDAGAIESPRESSQEDALFGGEAPLPRLTGKGVGDGGVPGQAPPPSPAPPGEPSQQAEDALFGGQGASSSQSFGEEVAPMNPLTLGGTLYLRSQLTGFQDHPPKDWGWAMPNLLDVYLDARPNSRVRALAVGRLTYDPTIDPSAATLTGAPLSQINTYLDQLWINFDIARTVFITAGKQHVKWGTGHFWNPTDYLQPVRLNPLDILDQRTGVTMVKAHIPWEARGWNFYAFAVFQNANGVVKTLGDIGGAARAELVFGNAELGLDAVVQHGRKPHFGVDLSSGLGPFDVFAEAAFHGADAPRIRLNLPPEGQTAGSIEELIEREPITGVQPQVTAGGSWQVNLNDRDALTLGLEGLYNSVGYDDPHVYPALIFTGNYTPFYVGKWYGGLYATASLPRGQTNHAITFTTLANISDASLISRLDYNVTLLRHLGLEVYGDVHYGTEGGEFRFGFNPASVPVGTGEIAPVVLAAPLFDLGIALRVSM